MTDDRAWEEASRKRLERAVAAAVSRLRAMADQIEAEAKHNIKAAQDGGTDYASYGRVAQQVVHEMIWGLANTNLSNVIDAATDADKARQEGVKS